jgi:hypothetical protein
VDRGDGGAALADTHALVNSLPGVLKHQTLILLALDDYDYRVSTWNGYSPRIKAQRPLGDGAVRIQAERVTMARNYGEVA